MKVNRKLMILAVLFLLLCMVMATQYAVTKIPYEYTILHPSDSNIRYIGSDNSSDGKRVIRISGSNTTNVAIKLNLGENLTTNQEMYYSAAFGIVNEEDFEINITHINVSSASFTYMKIWLHGDRDQNANDSMYDNSSVMMWDNTTSVNLSNTTAWTLAPGDGNSSTACVNYTDRANNSFNTTWDEIAHVRYSLNDTNAVSNWSDFVWVQVGLYIPDVVDHFGSHTGTIWMHFAADTFEGDG